MNKYQIYHEIKWLSIEIEKVKEQMKKRPSKWRHLKDLERQIKERRQLLGTPI
jgi:hypothetical protein